MRNFLSLTFWYWLYNQLFFFIGALGFFLIHFFITIIGLGGMDTITSTSATIIYVYILYKLFGRYLWRNRFKQYKPSSKTIVFASLFPVITGSIVLTICFAIANGNIHNTMAGMPVLAVINLSLSYLPLAQSVWSMLVMGFIFNLLTLICFQRYCKKYTSTRIPILRLAVPLLCCFVICTAVIYYITVTNIPAPILQK